MKKTRYLTLGFLLSLCVWALSFSAGAYDSSDLTIPSSATAICYGTSGAGRSLMAYQFGTGKNVMVLGFEIHGYEDNFAKDGGCLVYTAGQLMNLLDQNLTLLDEYDWTIYVLPSLNPDGLIDGYTNNGPGRCTTTYLTSSGTLSSAHGVDMNRSFPSNWTQNTTSRNYTGTQALACKESAALASFVQEVKGSGVNMCFDVHGWYSQIITSNGYSTLYNTLKAAFPSNTYASCRSGSGYFTAYTTALGYISCLFEFPGVSSFSAFTSSGYCEKFNNCILSLAKSYGTYGTGLSVVTTRTQGTGSGSVSGGGSYYRNKTVTLTAAASDGSIFDGWYDEAGNLLSTDASYSFAASGSVTIYAQFTLMATYTTSAEGHGTVTAGGTSAVGEAITLWASPDSGYTFMGWYDRTGALLGTDLSYTWTLNYNTTIIARFGAAVTLESSRSGSVSGEGVYADGAEAVLTATPAEDHTFLGWYDVYGNLISTESPYTVTVTAPQTLVAMFSDDVFYDIAADSWYLDAAMEAVERNLITGMNSITFSPDTEMTRAQLVTILARMEGADTDSAQTCQFEDVPQDAWYAAAVNWAAENGIVLGTTETTFEPDASVTREQFVTMVVRYMELVKGYQLEASDGSFTDSEQISDYAKEAVQKATALDIIDGYPDGSFQPKNTTPRREGVTILIRLAGYLDTHTPETDTEEPVEPTDPDTEEPTEPTDPDTEEPTEPTDPDTEEPTEPTDPDTEEPTEPTDPDTDTDTDTDADTDTEEPTPSEEPDTGDPTASQQAEDAEAAT